MPVEYEKRDHIGIVTLSRPTARNAWGADFNEGIERHFDAMEEDDDIRCAILTGDESGGAFSAGANLKDPKTHTMDSAEAHRIGLVQWLVPHAKLMDKALEVAAHVASLPPLAARLAKESLVRGLDIPNLSDASLVDLYRFAVLEQTEDKAEGHRAWREKRKPAFRGR